METSFLFDFKQAGTSFILAALKDYLYYCRIPIKKGLDIETEKPHLKRFIDKTFSRKCQLFIIAKNFKEDENTCNSCFKITSDIEKFGRMHVIWEDNSQYRVFTNLWRSFAQDIMNKEDLIDKCGHIDVNKYNCKTRSCFLLKSKRTLELHCTCIARLTIHM